MAVTTTTIQEERLYKLWEPPAAWVQSCWAYASRRSDQVRRFARLSRWRWRCRATTLLCAGCTGGRTERLYAATIAGVAEAVHAGEAR